MSDIHKQYCKQSDIISKPWNCTYSILDIVITFGSIFYLLNYLNNIHCAFMLIDQHQDTLPVQTLASFMHHSENVAVSFGHI